MAAWIVQYDAVYVYVISWSMDSVKLLTLMCTIHFRLAMAKSESTKYHNNRLKQSDPEKYKEMQELNRAIGLRLRNFATCLLFLNKNCMQINCYM